MAKGSWVWMNIACATPKPFKNIGMFVAYSFLHLDCLPPSPSKGNLPTKTIGEACHEQGQALMQALMLQVHDQLQQGQSATDVFARLAKQGVASLQPSFPIDTSMSLSSKLAQ